MKPLEVSHISWRGEIVSTENKLTAQSRVHLEKTWTLQLLQYHVRNRKPLAPTTQKVNSYALFTKNPSDVEFQLNYTFRMRCLQMSFYD